MLGEVVRSKELRFPANFQFTPHLIVDSEDRDDRTPYMKWGQMKGAVLVCCKSPLFVCLLSVLYGNVLLLKRLFLIFWRKLLAGVHVTV